MFHSTDITALAKGLFNPFGRWPRGRSHCFKPRKPRATITTHRLDVAGRRECVPGNYQLPGGPLAIAVGGEVRREELENSFSPLTNSGDIVVVGQQQRSAAPQRTALMPRQAFPLRRGGKCSSRRATTTTAISAAPSTRRWRCAGTSEIVLLLRTSWGTDSSADRI